MNITSLCIRKMLQRETGEAWVLIMVIIYGGGCGKKREKNGEVFTIPWEIPDDILVKWVQELVVLVQDVVSVARESTFPRQVRNCLWSFESSKFSKFPEVHT